METIFKRDVLSTDPTQKRLTSEEYEARSGIFNFTHFWGDFCFPSPYVSLHFHDSLTA
jgi:hypothetical protein